MDKKEYKYLVIEQHKFSTFNDSWTVKFADVDENEAFTKLVALRTLNEDKDKIYYIVNMDYLWTKDNDQETDKDKPLVLTDEIDEDKQQELF
jgi:ribosome-interacting GTPase 1|tara:strand:- start:42 stop:317 length:276 start_codon:yes stop_codon:yes gene_type:complete